MFEIKKDPDQSANLLRWVASYIIERDEEVEWVKCSTPIKKASMNFAGKFWWAIIQF